MSRLIENEREFNDLLRSRQKLLVLFYSSWCFYSRQFLPVFEEYARCREKSCCRVAVDELENLREEYGIEVYPTVLLFENGKVARRLDGTPGVGLDERQLNELVAACGVAEGN